jgi:hypothetical protein
VDGRADPSTELPFGYLADKQPTSQHHRAERRISRWRHGEDTRSLLARELANPVSPLVVSAQLSLAAEFPDQAQARMVLAAIGSGERTFTNIARAAGASPIPP